MLPIALTALLFVAGFFTTPTCFTNTPEKYPLAAAANAPTIALNPDADAVQLYAQIGLLTASERKQFFNILSGKNKAKVWQVHLSAYAISHDLNDAQSEFVSGLIQNLRGKDFATDRDSFNLAFIRERAIALFGREEAWELIIHLGGKSPFADNTQATGFSLAGKRLYDLGNKCTCNSGDDWCSSGTHCDNNQPCEHTSSGCGTFLWMPCNGKCM